MKVRYNKGMGCPVEISDGETATCISLEAAKELQANLSAVIEQAENKPEPELTPFEDGLRQVCEEAVKEASVSPDRTSEDFAKAHSAKLLALARKELIEEQYTSDPRKTDLYKLGKAEALKELPRWERSHKPHLSTEVKNYALDGYDAELWLLHRGRKINIKSLEKLPGFKED